MNLRILNCRLQLFVALPLLFMLFVPSSALGSGGTFDLFSSYAFLDNSRQSDTLDMAWGDIDGDGDPDVVLATARGVNRVYRNLGQGSFALMWESDDEYKTRSASLGDMDNDGDLDIIFGNDGAPVQVFENVGDDLFQLIWSSQKLSLATNAVAIGDVNADGWLDIAVGTRGYKNVIYYNTGAGTFEIGWESDENTSTYAIELGDLDNDNQLDLVVGNSGSAQVYQNLGAGSLVLAHTFEIQDTLGISLGDMNNDGQLDIAFSSNNDPDRVYRNNGDFAFSMVWENDVNNSWDVDWGDVNGDGYLDIAFGSWGVPYHDAATATNRVYINDGNEQFTLGWESTEYDTTWVVEWIDIDADGDLDLATGNSGNASSFVDPDRIYVNSGGGSFTSVIPFGAEQFDTRAIALGDADNDGDLDIAVGSEWDPLEPAPNQIFENNGRGEFVLAWQAPSGDQTWALAWGDVDDDGDLDLAVGNKYNPNLIYINEGDFNFTPLTISADDSRTYAIAWGDMDDDGDLDLAVANSGAPNQIYRNEFPNFVLVWQSEDSSNTQGIAWGDIDGDDDLDLITANGAGLNGQSNLVYKNDGTGNFFTSWQTPEQLTSRAVATGDFDADGDLDIVFANYSAVNQIYQNDGRGRFTLVWTEVADNIRSTTSLSVMDVNGDGQLDVSFGNWYLPNQIYMNQGNWVFHLAHEFDVQDLLPEEERPKTSALSWGDLDQDGDPDLVLGNYGAPNAIIRNTQYSSNVQLANNPPRIHFAQMGQAEHLATSKIVTDQIIPIHYTIFDAESDPIGRIELQFSLDGGGKWEQGGPAPETVTHNLTTDPEGTTYTFFWDTYTSGLFGQSDNVVLRLRAFPQVRSSLSKGEFRYFNSVAKTAQHLVANTTTYPLRVRGMQVQVLGDNAAPIPGAYVLRIPVEQPQTSEWMGTADMRFRTSPLGFLPGRGKILTGDKLVALQPISVTNSYTTHATSASPMAVGLDAHVVGSPGLQQLTASIQNPLTLFNLDISLEWDARSDAEFLADLERDIQRAAAILYDVTNGQAALGDVTVYHAGQGWDDADIRIHATNRLRPHATIGGLTQGIQVKRFPDLENSGPDLVRAYAAGHVYMPATWNRHGDAGSDPGDDWARTLVHELGHYLFYLQETYLGLDQQGLPLPAEGCPGVMNNPFVEEYTELHPARGWVEACSGTLQHQTYQRSGWEVLTSFYPWLHAPTGSYGEQNQGPSNLPLAVTNIGYVDPADGAAPPVAPSLYYLVHSDNRDYYPGNGARTFLYRNDTVVDLGQPSKNEVRAWGADMGDRLCIYDLGGDAGPYTGCLALDGSRNQIVMQPQPGWLPDVVVSPVTTNTLNIRVGNVAPGADLRAQIFPADRISVAGPAATIPLAFDGDTGVYAATVPLNLNAYLRIWDAGGTEREIVTDFALNGAPALVLGDGTSLVLGDGPALVLGDGTVEDLPSGSTQILHDGIALVLGDGPALVLGDGTTQPLPDGASLVLGDGTALVLGDGTALVLGDGTTQQLGDGTSLMLGDGPALVLGDGTTRLLGDGPGLVLGDGTALVLGDGPALVLGDGTSLVLGNGPALVLGDGPALVLGDGTSLVLGDGPALVLGDGTTQILGDGNGPILSSDGQVLLFVDQLEFAPGQYYVLQQASVVPDPLPWVKHVGQAYRITATPGAPDMSGKPISFRYLGRDVPDGEEGWLTIYYHDGSSWTPLETTLDREHNSAVALAQGTGVYALMSTKAIPLVPDADGWTMLGYSIEDSRPVSEALQSIAGQYTLVYRYEPASNPESPWLLYDVNAPSFVNTLERLETDKGYWIKLNEEVILYLEGPSAVNARTASMVPPSAFYGRVLENESFTPDVGMAVTAWINGQNCGTGETLLYEGQVVYRIIVVSAEERPGCGREGSVVTFQINGQTAAPVGIWDNNQSQKLALQLTVQPESSPTATATATATPTASATATPSVTTTPVPTITPTPRATATATPTASATATPSVTTTPAPTMTPTPTGTTTPTVTPTASATATPILTTTPIATATTTPTPTSTTSPIPTVTSTATLIPSATATYTPTATPIPALAPTATPSATATPVLTMTPTATATPIPSATATPTPGETPEGSGEPVDALTEILYLPMVQK